MKIIEIIEWVLAGVSELVIMNAIKRRERELEKKTGNIWMRKWVNSVPNATV